MAFSTMLSSPMNDINLPLVPFDRIRSSIHTKHQSFSLTPSIQNHALESFHLFPNLPVELRYRLWKLILDLTLPRFQPIEPITWDVPLGLQICQESRAEAKRRYQLLKSKVGGSMRIKYQFWVDYEKDILCINRDLDLFNTAKDRYNYSYPTPICGASCIFRDWLEPVKILAIDVNLPLSIKPDRDFPRFFKSLNEICPNLKELHVILSAAGTGGLAGPVVRMTKESYKSYSPRHPYILSPEDLAVGNLWSVMQMELWKAQKVMGFCKELEVKFKQLDVIAGLLAL